MLTLDSPDSFSMQKLENIILDAKGNAKVRQRQNFEKSYLTNCLHPFKSDCGFWSVQCIRREALSADFLW